jgi:endonuclease/exonuclease/phosphatase (EEP) superfamily protein YafD
MDEPARRCNWLWRLSLGYGMFLVVCYLLQVLVGEGAWVAMSLLYIAQAIYLLPLIPLLLWSIFRRRPVLPLIVNGLSICFVLVVLMGWRFRSDSSAEGGLRVLTYNIAHCAVASGSELGPIIASFDPDVILLQESTAWQGSKLDRFLDAYHTFPYNDDHNDLLIATKAPIVSMHWHPLDGAGEKVAQEAIVEDEGKRYRVINVHLTPMHAGAVLSSNPLGLPEHMRQKGAIKSEQFQRLGRLIGSSPLPVIVGGDFNAPANSPAMRAGLSELTDAFAATGSGFGYTLPSGFAWMRRDYIFCGKGFGASACGVPAITTSDHRPMLAQVKWSK